MSEANIQTRSQGPPEPQLLLDQIESETHIAKLREIVEKSKADNAMPRSPLYFQSAKGFLHPTTNQPLYSVAAFAAKCHELFPEIYPDPPSQSGSSHVVPAAAETVKPWVLSVSCGQSWSQAEFDQKPSLIQLMQFLQDDFGLDDVSTLRLHYSSGPTDRGEQWFVVSSDARLHKILQQAQAAPISWALRPAPGTPIQNRAGSDWDDSCSVRSVSTSRRVLAFPDVDSAPQEFAAPALASVFKQVEYARGVEKELRTMADTLLKPYDGVIAGARHDNLPAVIKVLRLFNQVEEGWTTVLRTMPQSDGVSQQQRLHWLLDACIRALAEPVRALWDLLPDEAQRAEHYSSLDVFLQALLPCVIPEPQKCKPTALPRALTSLVPWSTVSGRSAVVAQVEIVRKAAQRLNTLRQLTAADAINIEVQQFYISVLEPGAADRVRDLLYERYKAELALPLGELPELDNFTYAQIAATLQALDRRAGNWKDDFRRDLFLSAPTREAGGGTGTRQGRGAARASSGAAANSQTGGQATPWVPPAERTIRCNGQLECYPYYLRSVDDAQQKTATLQKFLGQTLSPLNRCTRCKATGHDFVLCPQLSKLDPTGVERNPKSFFFGLKLPPAVQRLAAPAALAVTIDQSTLEDIVRQVSERMAARAEPAEAPPGN